MKHLSLPPLRSFEKQILHERAAELKEPSLTGATMRVLARLTKCQNPKTGQCNPSNAYLAETLGLATRTVQNAIASLVAAKVIARICRSGRSNQYVLDPLGKFARGIALSHADERHEPTQSAAPKNYKETTKETSARTTTGKPCTKLQNRIAEKKKSNKNRATFERSVVTILNRSYENGYATLLRIDTDYFEHIFDHYSRDDLTFSRAVTLLRKAADV